MSPDRELLVALLAEAREKGFLGPGSIEPQIDHALAFARGVPSPAAALDLGSGGGLPGLALCYLAWPEARWVLLDSNARRCQFLRRAIEELGLGGRAEVLNERAEIAGRDPQRRCAHDLVTSRTFGRPALVAECAAPFLRTGGWLVVSEPPGGEPGRWPAEPLAALGLVADVTLGSDEGASMARFKQVTPCPDRYPRRTGVPAKRPLF